MKIKVDKTKCTGCLICEITCSLLNTGMLQREASAIQVSRGDLSDTPHEPVVCRQCKKMVCLKVDGKDFDADELNKFYWDDKKRVEHCPYSAIFIFKEKVIHCNLCKGDPECVKSCPTGALKVGA